MRFSLPAVMAVGLLLSTILLGLCVEFGLVLSSWCLAPAVAAHDGQHSSQTAVQLRRPLILCIEEQQLLCYLMMLVLLSSVLFNSSSSDTCGDHDVGGSLISYPSLTALATACDSNTYLLCGSWIGVCSVALSGAMSFCVCARSRGSQTGATWRGLCATRLAGWLGLACFAGVFRVRGASRGSHPLVLAAPALALRAGLCALAWTATSYGHGLGYWRQLQLPSRLSSWVPAYRSWLLALTLLASACEVMGLAGEAWAGGEGPEAGAVGMSDAVGVASEAGFALLALVVPAAFSCYIVATRDGRRRDAVVCTVGESPPAPSKGPFASPSSLHLYPDALFVGCMYSVWAPTAAILGPTWLLGIRPPSSTRATELLVEFWGFPSGLDALFTEPVNLLAYAYPVVWSASVGAFYAVYLTASWLVIRAYRESGALDSAEGTASSSPAPRRSSWLSQLLYRAFCFAKLTEAVAPLFLGAFQAVEPTGAYETTIAPTGAGAGAVMQSAAATHGGAEGEAAGGLAPAVRGNWSLVFHGLGRHALMLMAAGPTTSFVAWALLSGKWAHLPRSFRRLAFLFGLLTVASWGYRAFSDMLAVMCYMAELDCGAIAMGDMHVGNLVDLGSICLSVLPTFVMVALMTCWRQPERCHVRLAASLSGEEHRDAEGFVPLP